ncbi:CPBP family intramembrane glutamic endopeptidase [Paenibacillus sp. FA6]|uniref:CPBP family intramembrane glutamic endopeptidase n=1 Tax=Paenibacillus sp. FA6 TaxID=3413029 RepID=UPI003F6596FF
MAMFVIFVGTVISIQITTVYMSLGWIIILCGIHLYKPVTRRIRDVSFLSALYALGYWITVSLNSYITDYLIYLELPRELIIACSRLSLIGFVVPFILFKKMDKTTTDYMAKGSFTESIHFPLIWHGVKDPIWRFLLIASCVVILSFSFVIDVSPANIKSLLWASILFALINSVLEEILWRGLILSRFVDMLGEGWGLIIVSIGFGMYHYSIGFPWSICVLFSIFGMLLGGIAIRSKGLIPVIILHFIMNILFALSGLIF